MSFYNYYLLMTLCFRLVFPASSINAQKKIDQLISYSDLRRFFLLFPLVYVYHFGHGGILMLDLYQSLGPTKEHPPNLPRFAMRNK